MRAHLPKVTRVRALAAIVVLLASAALYEALVALRVIPMGKVAGEGPFGSGVVLLIALLALLTGLVVSLSGTSSRSSVWRSVVLVIAAVLIVGGVASLTSAAGAIALLVLLIGLIVSLSYTSSRGAEWISVAPLVAPAAAAFVVARFFSFDDYYLPTLRRMSDGGWVPWQLIVVLAALALLAAATTKIRPQIGVALTSFVLFISALTAVAEGVGH